MDKTQEIDKTKEETKHKIISLFNADTTIRLTMVQIKAEILGNSKQKSIDDAYRSVAFLFAMDELIEQNIIRKCGHRRQTCYRWISNMN